jgi:nanoRNase/pAp phosphatase (c-di-AMP/oligoRNAs hydrolase)
MKRAESILSKDITRNNLNRLTSLVRKNDSLAILMYGAPDPDAVASAMALKEIVSKTVGLAKCTFVSTDPVARQQNVELIREMKISIELLDKVPLADYRLVALMDAQPPFFGKALENITPQIVLDHHPREGEWRAELEDIRPRYGALSTILTEYLLASQIKISRRLYTALLYGIKTDTNGFERDAILEDVSAYYLTFARANRQLIRRIELNQIPDRFIKYFDHAYHYRRRYRDRIICYLGRVENTDVCVQVADFFLNLINIYYVVIAGMTKDRLVIVFRGDGYRQDCGAIAQKAFGAYGSAGGHKSAARVEISLDTLRDLLKNDLTQEGVDHFLVQHLRGKRIDKEP